MLREDELCARREYEKRMVALYDAQPNPDDVYYIVEATWLAAFVQFIEGSTDELPGPILNHLLLEPERGQEKGGDDGEEDEGVSKVPRQPRPGLERAKDYRGVTSGMWQFITEQYGGAPVIVRGRLDIYAEELEPELRLKPENVCRPEKIGTHPYDSSSPWSTPASSPTKVTNVD
jgi:hypothetical protein